MNKLGKFIVVRLHMCSRAWRLSLRPVHFKEKGTGPLDTSLYNALINLLLGELEGVVTSTVEEAVCTLLEDAFASSG